jgi:hypothetical protein
MNNLTKFFLLALLVAFQFNCKKSQVKDVYYVRYEVESQTIYTGGKLNVQISNENGNLPLVINQRQSWETTIGPVSKGFKATLNVTKQGWDGISAENHLKLYLRIQVSKNNEPFALKEINGSDSPRATASIDYVLE